MNWHDLVQSGLRDKITFKITSCNVRILQYCCSCCRVKSSEFVFWCVVNITALVGHKCVCRLSLLLNLFPLCVFLHLSLLVLDIMDSGDPAVCLCCCLSIRLSELLSVNVGLFDQYFRVVGQWIYTSVLAEFTQINTKLLPNADITLCYPLTYSWTVSLSLCVCRSFGWSHRLLSQQGQLWDEPLPSGADVSSQSAAAASSSRAVRSGLLLSVHKHKHR